MSKGNSLGTIVYVFLIGDFLLRNSYLQATYFLVDAISGRKCASQIDTVPLYKRNRKVETVECIMHRPTMDPSVLKLVRFTLHKSRFILL